MSKKTTMAVGFCLGALMLVTTAFADVTAKTGYDCLKEAIKHTVNSCADDLQSFSTEMTVTLKDNEEVLFSANELEKYDMVNGKMESISSEEWTGEKPRSYFYYTDRYCRINKGSDNEYQVYEFSEERDMPVFDSPFQDENAADMEKIFDAFIGDLKNNVLSDKKPDGSLQLAGSINEMQIPAWLNAISAFAVKNEFSEGNDWLPRLSQDIVIQGIEGKATVNQEGLLESILGTVVIGGKDVDGNVHQLTMEILIKVKDINKTKISKPDLTGKKVEKNVEKAAEKIAAEDYLGTYQSDIVIRQEGQFVKIGERVIEIIEANEQQLTGSFVERYNEENEDSENALSFDFKTAIRKNRNDMLEFEFVDPEGRKKTGCIRLDESNGNLYFYFDFAHSHYDPHFRRIFE